MKTAIITGVCGQVGSHMLDFLLSRGYKVIGIKRRTASNNTWRISENLNHSNFELIEGDITDAWSMSTIIGELSGPFDIYHFAAMSHVGSSFREPQHCCQTIVNGTLNILECIRRHPDKDKIRMYNSSSSEMFGNNFDVYQSGVQYQNEDTRFKPTSPYACAKVASHHLCELYRRAYGIWVCSGITFNMEGPFRGEEFVTRKITKWIGEYKAWRESVANYRLVFKDKAIYAFYPGRAISPEYWFSQLALGNWDSYRDWQHTEDAVRGMYLMVNADEPKDYVISSGKTHSVKDFLTAGFNAIGIYDWSPYVYQDPKFMRPSDLTYLLGDSSLIRKELGWEPKYTFDKLVHEMVKADYERAKKTK